MKNKIEAFSQKMKQKEREMHYKREMIRNLKYQFRRSNTQRGKSERKREKGRNC